MRRIERTEGLRPPPRLRNRDKSGFPKITKEAGPRNRHHYHRHCRVGLALLEGGGGVACKSFAMLLSAHVRAGLDVSRPTHAPLLFRPRYLVRQREP